MNLNYSLTRSIMMIVLFAGGTGIALADDSSIGRFSDDIYAYFDENKPVVINPPPAFRKTHPNGLSEREYQELSSEGAVWHPGAVTDKTPSTFRQTNPNGLSERDYQALSSNSSLWQAPGSPNLASAGSPHAVSKKPL
jgi:hypothetical protein